MREFQGRRRVKRLLYSKYSVTLVLVIIIFLSQAVWRLYQKDRFTQGQKDEAVAELEELSTKKKSLSTTVAALETTAGVEAAIRQKFAVVKPGEYVVTVVGDEPPVAPPPAKSWWEKLFDN